MICVCDIPPSLYLSLRVSSFLHRALYTYEDNTNDLTLASSGGGGLPEITLSFESTRVMYGFCSLKEPTAALPRYILINWVGEDVPDARKCACASHVATIAEFFQGVDVIINASSIEDIDPAAIGQRLTNGMGPVASPVLSRLRMRDEEHPDTVGTSYQKTNAEIEMKKINREEFWEQAKREEELRKEEERRKAAEERQRFEEERMEQERREQEERERRYREREQQIEEHRKKLLQSQEDEEAKEKTRDPSLFVEPENESSAQDRKESEVEEAAAIIAQRTENPREFFKQREKAVACSFDSSPVSGHRTATNEQTSEDRMTGGSVEHDARNLSMACKYSYARKKPINRISVRLQHSLPEPSSSPPRSPLLSPAPPHARLQPGQPASPLWNLAERECPPEKTGRERAPMPSQIPCYQGEHFQHLLLESTPEPEQPPPVQETSPAKPVQSVAPQAREPLVPSGEAADESGSLLDLWESSDPQVPPVPNQEPLPALVDLSETSPTAPPAALTDLAPGDEPAPLPQPLLSFDDLPEPPASFCEGAAEEDDPSSLVDVAGTHPMTISYQHALQQASGSDSQDLDDGQLLMTNGEALLKEGTQASEGYFSQSQEEEFAQSEESSAKITPTPVFYNKPPEIDITCWDNDPVTEDDEYGAAE
uniref:Drebrin n=1 Tax=Lepisosteus oculatus TaxID=7918 RepID=W5N3F4_LEPOC